MLVAGLLGGPPPTLDVFDTDRIIPGGGGPAPSVVPLDPGGGPDVGGGALADGGGGGVLVP